MKEYQTKALKSWTDPSEAAQLLPKIFIKTSTVHHQTLRLMHDNGEVCTVLVNLYWIVIAGAEVGL